MSIKYVHTNLVARDWHSLSQFYQKVFKCTPVPPKRDLSGRWLEQATGVAAAQLQGEHLRLPGYDDQGPTLEIFQYTTMPEHPQIKPNTPGFAHIAFAVDDVAQIARAVFENGGSPVGDLTVREVPGMGCLTFQYVTDPEGNIVEIQKWDHS